MQRNEIRKKKSVKNEIKGKRQNSKQYIGPETPYQCLVREKKETDFKKRVVQD